MIERSGHTILDKFFRAWNAWHTPAAVSARWRWALAGESQAVSSRDGLRFAERFRPSADWFLGIFELLPLVWSDSAGRVGAAQQSRARTKENYVIESIAWSRCEERRRAFHEGDDGRPGDTVLHGGRRGENIVRCFWNYSCNITFPTSQIFRMSEKCYKNNPRNLSDMYFFNWSDWSVAFRGTLCQKRSCSN